MTKIFLIVIFFLSLLNMSGQSNPVGDRNGLTIGYGFPNLTRNILTKDLLNSNAQLKSVATSQGGTFTYPNEVLGPIFVKYDFALTEKFGVGLVVGYFDVTVSEVYQYKNSYGSQSAVTGNYNQTITNNVTSLSVGARFNYHFGNEQNFDPYFGLAVGYSNTSEKESFTSNDPGVPLPETNTVTSSPKLPLYIAGTLGARVYLTKHLGFYGEFGFDKFSLIQLGLATKF